MDTKYIPSLLNNKIDNDIIRQLCGYARDKKLFDTLANEIIPCLIIYPKEGELENPFKNKSLEELISEGEYKEVYKFYRIAVPLPTLGN